MTLSEFERKRHEKAANAFIKRVRPQGHIRHQLDISYRLTDQSIEVMEIRPKWNDPSVFREHLIAKATWTKTTQVWKVYWMRSDQKWHRYEPMPEVPHLEDFLSLVEKDEFACFWG